MTDSDEAQPFFAAMHHINYKKTQVSRDVDQSNIQYVNMTMSVQTTE